MGDETVNELAEKGLITEMQFGANLALVINEGVSLLPTEYKVLLNQTDDTFLKCMKVQFNGKPQLYYLTDGLRPLSELLPVISPDNILAIIADLLADVINVNNIGFLSCQSIDISMDHIYVDANTYKTKLTYLPLSRRIFSDYSIFENELRTSLVRVISTHKNLASSKTAALMSNLSNGMYSLSDVCKRIKSGAVVGGGVSRPAAPVGVSGRPITINPPVSRSGGQSGAPRCRIVALSAPFRVEIDINKDQFLLGKKAESVDGAITFNNMISRVHCRIDRQGVRYTVTDLQSANGTFVNHKKLQPNVPFPIKNGDILRLANSDFQVSIG